MSSDPDSQDVADIPPEIVPPEDGPAEAPRAAEDAPITLDAKPSLPARARSAKSERDLEPASALTRYMSQLAHHAPISREEEHELRSPWSTGAHGRTSST